MVSAVHWPLLEKREKRLHTVIGLADCRVPLKMTVIF
jgi:hypothetical protein